MLTWLRVTSVHSVKPATSVCVCASRGKPRNTLQIPRPNSLLLPPSNGSALPSLVRVCVPPSPLLLTPNGITADTAWDKADYRLCFCLQISCIQPISFCPHLTNCQPDSVSFSPEKVEKVLSGWHSVPLFSNTALPFLLPLCLPNSVCPSLLAAFPLHGNWQNHQPRPEEGCKNRPYQL